MLLFGVCGGWLQVPLDYSYFAVFIGHSSYLQSSDRSTMRLCHVPLECGLLCYIFSA
jgi:hypothetical protein